MDKKFSKKNKENLKNFFFQRLIIGFLFALIFVLCAHKESAAAASLYFSPREENWPVGSSFSVDVYVSSIEQPINAVGGAVLFSSDKLEIASISKSGSIINFWAKEPTFSNTEGTLNFEGVVLSTKGFEGQSGKILTINFRAKDVGEAILKFSEGLVLAHDGLGSNILKDTQTARFNIFLRQQSLVSARISSPTHPDSNKWYSNNKPKFVWELPAEVDSVRMLYNNQPYSIPSVFYSKPISEKQLEELPDGIYYFHLQLHNKDGWGEVTHFKFQIDTQPPKFLKIEIKEGNQTTNSQPTLIFKSADEISGIDYHEIIIDGRESIRIDSYEYKVPPLALGKHIIIVKAVDKAGNETLAMTEVEILPIDAPVIVYYPKELIPGNILFVRGTSIPEATVVNFIQSSKGEIRRREVKSDRDGKWTFIETEPLEEGVYEIWAEAVDASGAKSKSSNVVTVLVSPPTLIKVGKIAISYLTTIITLCALTFSLIVMILWFLERKKKQERKLKKEVSKVEEVAYQAFEILKEEIEKQIAKLDGQPGLSERERKICNDLRKSLKTSEELINKEIRTIEKELK